ncbi:MAG: amidohydrolase family protein [Deltaproteobacteria bacterium]|nr:amidohydrolase family protein [Deltaproteobacteria bacterium]
MQQSLSFTNTPAPISVVDGTISSALAAPTIELDCRQRPVEPGRVNAHTHIYSGLAPLGMPAPSRPPSNFLQILERIWWRLDRALDPPSLRAAARLYVAEALLHGTTTLVDHHESPNMIDGSLDIIADACEELGMRAVLCFGATERNGGTAEANAGLDECARFINTRHSSLLRGMVALHASFTCSDQTLVRAGDLCRELHVPLHIHLAEDLADLKDAQRRGYQGPLERLIALDALPRRSILAHGVHLAAAQVERCRGSLAILVQNPRSNEGNRVGYPKFFGGQSHVALGTDGYPADMLSEEAALERLAMEHGDADWQHRPLGGYQLVDQRFSRVFGRLAPGSAGDLCVRDQDGKPIHVCVDGQLVVRDGQLVRADIEEIRADAMAQAKPLFARMAAL